MSDETQPSLTYAGAGVDIDARERTARRLGEIARSTHDARVLPLGGAFAGLFRLGARYRDPVLVGTTDGVGTKLMIAAAAGRFEDVGRDLVNANVNDLITVGAEPLFFLDYLATTDLAHEHRVEIVRGVAAACLENGVALIGGETADMPDTYRAGDFDAAGFLVGVVERDAVIDASGIGRGDALLAIPSSGPHTNGYSLVREIWGLGKGMGEDRDRRVLDERHESLGGRTLGEALLEVHVSYYPALRDLYPRIRGMAHITGGGIPDNLPRMLGSTLAAQIDRASWRVPAIFELIRERGGVSDLEMFRTFNMGVGMIIAVRADEADELLRSLPTGSWRIGEVVDRGDGPPVRGLDAG